MTNPLLVWCAPVREMLYAGMMDTVLNLGLNDVTVAALAAKTGDARFTGQLSAVSTNMYGDVVMGIMRQLF